MQAIKQTRGRTLKLGAPAQCVNARAYRHILGGRAGVLENLLACAQGGVTASAGSLGDGSSSLGASEWCNAVFPSTLGR